MSENIKTSYILKKVTPNDVYTRVSSINNPTVYREVYLTEHMPQQTLPRDWALGFLMDQGNFTLFQKGIVTFDDNASIIKEAIEAGVWFGDIEEITPVKEDTTKVILSILKAGNRSKIQDAITKYGDDMVRDVASHNVESLTIAVTNMLENMLHMQLVIDEQ